MARNVSLPMPPKGELIEQYQVRGLTYPQLSEIYSVSPATLSKWFKHYGIETRNKAQIKVIGKEQHRICTGILHPEGAWVPLRKFYKNAGKPFGRGTRCVDCLGVKARVEFTPVYQGWVTSIIRRLGVLETCRRLGVHDKTLRTWQGKSKIPRPRTIRRTHAEAIVKVLGELRITGEVRHRHSIKRGAAVRGEAERVVKTGQDLYVRSGGNSDTEYRRKRRRDNPEIREAESKRYYARKKLKQERERLTDAA